MYRRGRAKRHSRYTLHSPLNPILPAFIQLKVSLEILRVGIEKVLGLNQTFQELRGSIMGELVVEVRKSNKVIVGIPFAFSQLIPLKQTFRVPIRLATGYIEVDARRGKTTLRREQWESPFAA